MNQYKELLRRRVIKEIDLCREVGDDELYETIDRILLEFSREEYVSITEKLRLRKDIFNSEPKFNILYTYHIEHYTNTFNNGACSVFAISLTILIIYDILIQYTK